MQSVYCIADYLMDRLADCGIRHLFGLPGDYNLQFLDHVIAHPDIRWVGCANELNAAYAADGYARVNGAGALLTTYGVGELSALNGIAGSFAEYLPVLHIVGAPCTGSQQRRERVHHTLGDGQFEHFYRMSEAVTASRASLTVENASHEIDRVLSEMRHHSRPGYLLLPADVAQSPAQPPAHPLPSLSWQADTNAMRAFLAAAKAQLQGCQRVALLADFLAQRFGLQSLLQESVSRLPLAHGTLLMGKGLFNEQQAGFVGTYSGAASEPFTREAIEEADCILTVGIQLSDTQTAGFSQRLPLEKTIELQPEAARVGERWFSGLPMADAWRGLAQLCGELAAGWQPPAERPAPAWLPRQGRLTQDSFWQTVQAALLPGDIVVADQGTAAFGAAALTLPEGAMLINQPLWGSIGFALPAAFGAQTAAPDKRVVLITGDGAAQLTIQELGSMLRDGQRLLMIVLNNDGYTVERAIHGAEQRYNDIARWDWAALPHALDVERRAQSWRVTEDIQLHEALERAAKGDRLTLIDVILPKQELPALLQAVARALEARNSGH